MLLNNFALFLQIVEKGSLAAASREAGLSPTTVSERLAALEAHFGVVLLNRTTRRTSLTDEGRALVEGAKLVLGEVEDLESRIRLGAQTLSGPIRISAPSDIGRTVVSSEINHFLSAHPAISVELLLSDGFVDIVGEGFDIALRFGPITDSSLRVRSLGLRRRVLCAAPSYLEKHGAPKKPVDLKQHNCLVMRFGANLDNVWRFGPNTLQQIVTVRGDRVANDGALVRQWCLDGHGIMLKSELDVGPDLRAGKLIELLPDFAPPPTPVQLLFPPSRAQPKRVRALADQLALTLQGLEQSGENAG
ncbi:MAG: LysR family transcriptional regulator [Gammaproteobacteria bacterium]|nr:LysR family transcriptional regulator [Rhodocyclaceae bacterium]MBU3909941.1 LysR family transcriptional regulator [Gammaproteobacteria bacterium]MBU3988048.1 LysR family transcriptional regulator [Gammaproteobacteria bacterium]MBU4003480.1 LysR family transcriptional regulator [Gammaproteobacteria bacterium]MBU4020161.1 LysR family transcriptional regulator [Gammaproteobacteria bacterium]